MYEKKLIILTGRKTERGTIRLERSSMGLYATLNVSGIEQDDYMLAVVSSSKRYDYPIGVLPSDAVLEIDGQIKIDEAHFTVYKRYGEATLYGTLNRERVWWGNLPDGRGGGEKEIDEANIDEKVAKFSFSKIAPSAQREEKFDYDDEQVADENYYEIEPDRIVEKPAILTKKDNEPESVLEVESYEPCELEQTPSIKIGDGSVFEGRKADFYEKKRDEIEKLFSSRRRVEELEKLLPFSKWVKIDYDAARHYVVGVIGVEPDFICYGVPSVYTPTPPSRICGGCVFLPLNPVRPQGEGYWLFYQDAKSGKIIKRDEENSG
jgi:hypothetical protein